MPNNKTLSDALHRLLVVIGCVVLATAQPMSAFAAGTGTDTQRSPETVIYPKGSPEKTVESPSLKTESSLGSGSYFIIVLLLVGTGAWMLWKRKSGDLGFGQRIDRKLLIEESKSLGNRQYLVVASYEGKRFLLGVTTDQIQLLTHLPDHTGKE